MFSAWTKHLKTPEGKARLENSIRGSKPVLERLDQLLEEEERNIDRSETDIRQFDTPNWSEKQAYKNGQRSAYSLVKKIINLDLTDKE